MESNVGFKGFFRHNKKLEYGFLVIGLVLFIALSARGLQKIDDRAVAAGDANKNAIVETDLDYAGNLSAQAKEFTLAAQRQQLVDQNQQNQKQDVVKQTGSAVADTKRASDNAETKEQGIQFAKGQDQKDTKQTELVH